MSFHPLHPFELKSIPLDQRATLVLPRPGLHCLACSTNWLMSVLAWPVMHVPK